MINNDWERFGDEIRRTIQDAVDTRDFSRLNQTVSDTVGRAVDAVSHGVRNGGWYRDNPMQRGKGDQPANGGQQSYKNMNHPEKRLLYLKGTSTKVGGIFLAVTGYVFLAGSVVFLALLAAGAAATGWNLLLKIGMGAFGVFALAFLFMAITGTNMTCTVGRFRRYVKILQDREYCDVKELSHRTGRSLKAVLKDLRKMIRKGWFRQGHLDPQGTCLMVSDKAYRQYTDLMDQMKKEKAEREEAAARQQQEYSKLSPEVQKILKAGDDYVRKIREANDAIPGEEISAKMSRMEMLVDRIFDRVEENPESVDDIRKLMEYYLPTTIKLLEAYEDLDAQPVQGENIISSKKEIEKTIDTLNTAFEKLLDDLFRDTAWDVSSDISVLHTMLAQEGLTEDGLKTAGKQ
nr:5-bromo-4-chloroindolyl phosphate hydrolysis family protein [uncultured Mediterraneibacter sp.]